MSYSLFNHPTFMMRIHVKDLEKLKHILEDRSNYEIYSWYLGSDVVHAEVKMYEHDGGVTIEDMPGRWWLYVRAYGKKPELFYDIALWKLRNTPVFRKLLSEEAIEVKREESEEQFVSV